MLIHKLNTEPVKKSSSFLILLLLMSWTVSFAQTGKPAADTIKCYSLTELRYIAATIVEGRACVSSLANANAKLANRESFIKEKEIEISGLNKQLSLKDQLLLKKDEDIKTINLNLDKEKRKHKWTKYGWAATSVLLVSLVFIVAVH